MESPGAYLKRERELRGITLKGVHEAIRVPLKFLEALEADNYDALPHPTFVKGYIKTYCKHLGLDEVDAVLRFEIFMRERAVTTEKPEKAKKPETKRFILAAEKGPSNFRAVIPFVAAGIIIIIFLFYIGYSRREGPVQVAEAPAPEEKPALEAQAPDAQMPNEQVKEGPKPPLDEHPVSTAYVPPQTPDLAARPAEDDKAKALKDAQARKAAEASRALKAPPEKRHTLTATATETVWIKIAIDSGEPFDVMLKEGDSASWKSAGIVSIIVGNAGGVAFTYDGRTLPPLGKSGEVVNFNIPEDLYAPGNREGKDASVNPTPRPPEKPAAAPPEETGEKTGEEMDERPPEAPAGGLEKPPI